MYKVEDHITQKLYERIGFPIGITQDKLDEQ